MVKFSTVKNQEEYEQIKNLLEHKLDSINTLTKDKRYRILQKSKNFILIGGELYLEDITSNKNLALVLHNEQIDKMKLIARQQHKENHEGMNKMYAYLQTKYFLIKREIVREVYESCISCLQSGPLKKKLLLKI